MSINEVTASTTAIPMEKAFPLSADAAGGHLHLKMVGESLEVSYWPGYSTDPSPMLNLPVPTLEVLEGGMLDPSLRYAYVRVAPYSGMRSGDKVVLNWHGLDAEGLSYRHETSRSVSEGQVGQDIVFVVKGIHVAALERGSLALYWTLYSVDLPEPVSSRRLHLNVGDPEPELLAPSIEETVGGTLDPDRISHGTSVTVRPYARMAAGDTIILSWQGPAGEPAFSDRLTVEPFAVGEALSFWISADRIVPFSQQELMVSYQVVAADTPVRHSASSRILIAPLVRGDLAAPEVLEAPDGELDVADAMDGVTVVIANAQAEEGELVYLKCNGEYFSHRDDRDITQETAGQSLVFIVPYRFWREHRETVVEVSYQVERLDDVSQVSGITHIQVRA